jgi:phosphatidylglycerol:prolipoprotein diacylglycerol transferase
MHPILLKIGPVTIYTYGALLVLAFTLATWQTNRTVRSLPDPKRITPNQATDLACVALLGGILGARLFFAALHWQFFLHEPLALFALWQGGLVWYGGFVGGLLSAWWYARRHRLPLVFLADLFAPALALGHAIGRIGCFLNGCCYGAATDAWCGVSMPGAAERVYPTQLMESLGLFVIYIILRRLQTPARMSGQPGRLFGIYLTAYGALRFVVEQYRGDQVPVLAGLTLQQLVSILVLLAGILFIRFHHASPKRSQ